MNRLDQFILNNREAFDDEMPSRDLWPDVQHSLEDDKSIVVVHAISLWRKWAIAASVLLVTAGISFYLFTRSSNAGNTIANSQDSVNALIAEAAPEEAPQVNEIVKLVSLKQQELKLLAAEQPALYQKFTADMNELDSSYSALKQQLQAAPSKEVLIEAMVQNLQLQLDILNRQLQIIKQIKQHKKYSHEKNKDFI